METGHIRRLPARKKGVSIFDIKDKKIIGTRDVNFIESIFLFAKNDLERDDTETNEIELLDRKVQKTMRI